MATIVRWFMGRLNGIVDCTLPVNMPNLINRTVQVSVSEGNDAHDAPFPQDFHPQRFLGSASMWVENVCPRFQEIQFRLVVDWDQPLCVWADILISDELPDTIEES